MISSRISRAACRCNVDVRFHLVLDKEWNGIAIGRYSVSSC